MKLYKLRHNPTGLFFKPNRGYSKNNLSKIGKVYSTKPSLKWVKRFYQVIDNKSVLVRDRQFEWEIVEIEMVVK